MKNFSLDDRTAMISTKADMDSFCEIDTCDNAKLNFQNIKKSVFYEKPSSFGFWNRTVSQTVHFKPFLTVHFRTFG